MNNLLNLLNKSVSPFHVVNNIKEELLRSKFIELNEKETFKLEKGKSYFLIRNDSSIIAFKTPHKDINSIKIVASHTDSPTFKIKPNPLIISNNLMLLETEPYGGAIYYSWLDKPLSVAGRIAFVKENKLHTKLINIDEDLLTIPSLAIHMNRDINNSLTINPAIDLNPILGNLIPNFSFNEYLKNKANLDNDENILSFDLFLYNRQKAIYIGINNEFIASPRLDDLSSLYTSMLSFIDVAPTADSLLVFVAFNNEEVGSLTRQGANSTFLKDTLTRVLNDKNKYEETIARSVMLSVDNGHANHPNHLEYSSKTTNVKLNEGIVIKYNANEHYTSDALSSALVKMLANKANIKFQEYTNRSDLRGGITLGNISNSEVSLMCADIGLPQLAMHSSYELIGKNDANDMLSLISYFYKTNIKLTNDGFLFE